MGFGEFPCRVWLFRGEEEPCLLSIAAPLPQGSSAQESLMNITFLQSRSNLLYGRTSFPFDSLLKFKTISARHNSYVFAREHKRPSSQIFNVIDTNVAYFF